MSVDQSLAQFHETESPDAFSLQNSKLLKVELADVTIQAKLGSMVAYQGDVKFEHAGSGGVSRMLKKAVTSEGTNLMKISGTGEVFLADIAQDIHLIQLEDERSPRTAPTSSRSTTASTGTSSASRAPRARSRRPVQHGARGQRLGRDRLRRPAASAPARRRADLRRPAGGDHLVQRREHLGQGGRERQDAHRPRLGRDHPGRILRLGLAPIQPSEGRSRGPPAAVARAAAPAPWATSSAASPRSRA